MKIDMFTGEYRFLSNFWAAEVTLYGDLYPTVEHAYQAGKTLNYEQRRAIRQTYKASSAKQLGKSVTLRKDWNKVKDTLMLDLLRQKFSLPILKEKLLATRDAELIEGNGWGDTYWGVCNGVGENRLGKLLMQVRNEIRSSIS